MDWVGINTILLIAILILLIDVKRSAITTEQILLYLGLNADEVREMLKGTKEELFKKLGQLRVSIPDQVLKDFRNEKKRNERKN